MEQVRDWLPEQAFKQESAELILREPLSLWSGRWFTRVDAEVRSARVSCANSQVAQGIQVRGTSSEIRLSGRGKRALLEAALATDLSTMILTESDHKVLDSLATEIASDLLATLDPIGAGFSAEPVLSITLALAGVEMAVLDLSMPAFIPVLKKAMGPAREPAQKPRSRIEALKRTFLRVEGYLGRAELTLNELQGLGIGDVIILEKTLKDPVELRLPGSQQFIRRGKLVRTTESISIQF